MMNRVIGYTFGVGVRKGAKIGEGGSYLFLRVYEMRFSPTTREYMDDIRLVLYNSVNYNAEVKWCCCKRDKIILRYDPLLSRCFITIVFTRLVIGDDDD